MAWPWRCWFRSRSRSGARRSAPTYQYNKLGTLIQVAYPNPNDPNPLTPAVRRTVNMSYNPMGRLTNIHNYTDTVGVAPDMDVVYNANYRAGGLRNDFRYGNGLQENRDYDPDRLQLASLWVIDLSTSSTPMSYSYVYTETNGKYNGQLQKTVDNASSPNTIETYSTEATMRSFAKWHILLFVFLLCVSITDAFNQARDPKDIFGNQSGDTKQPSQDLHRKTLADFIRESQKNNVGTIIDGNKNPEMIPEYMVWERFCGMVHTMSHNAKNKAPNLNFAVYPEEKTIAEAVGLTSEQSTEIAGIANDCNAKGSALMAQYRKSLEKRLAGKSIASLPETQLKDLEKEDNQMIESSKALMESCKKDVLSLLDPDQGNRFKIYLLNLARGMGIGTLRK